MNKRTTMFSIFGLVDKVNITKAFDAYCDGAEIIINDARYALDDEQRDCRAIISKKIVVLSGRRDVFRFHKFVEELKTVWNTKRLHYYVKQKHRRS